MRIITHTDFDGICCAALFLRKYGNDITIHFATVNEARNLSERGIEFDFSCDLPKVGNSINIDHHKSNYEDLIKSERIKDEDLIDPNAPSATDIVFTFLAFQNDPISNEIRELGNLSDTAQLPDEYRPLDIILNLNSDNPEVLRHISHLLSVKGHNILKTDWLLNKYVEYREIFEKTRMKINSFIESNDKFPRILILDTRGVIPGKLAKEVFRPLFERGVVIIALIYSKSDKESNRVSFRVTKENNEQKFYDVSLVAKVFNGGGHTMAAACTITSKDIPTNLIREIRKIAKPTDEIQYLHL